MFVCLLVCVFFVPLENFSLMTGEGLQILTYARHSWPLSCEDGTPNVTRGIHSFKMVISEDPWPSHLLSSVWQLSIAVFFDLGLSQLGFDHPNVLLVGRTSQQNRRGCAVAFTAPPLRYYWLVKILNKKHIDASVKERPRNLLVPSEEIYKIVLCNKHI